MSNMFGYGGASPYIYVDPDGNSIIAAIIGAVVGAVCGAVSAAANGGDWKAILCGAVVGAVIGAVSGGAASAAAGAAGGGIAGALAGAATGAATSAACNMVVSAAYGASARQVFVSGAISFGCGLVSGAIGAGIGQIGNQVGQAIAGYASSLAVSYAAAGLTGGLNEDTWDDVLLSSSISYWAGYAGSAVGEEIESAGEASIEKYTIAKNDISIGKNEKTNNYNPDTGIGKATCANQSELQKEVHQLTILEAVGKNSRGETIVRIAEQVTLKPGTTMEDVMNKSFELSYDPNIEGADYQREVSVAFYTKLNENGESELHAGMMLGAWGEHSVDNPFFDAIMPGANTEIGRDFGLQSPGVQLVAESHTHPDFQQGIFDGNPSAGDVSLARQMDSWNRSVPDVKSYLISKEGIFSYANKY
jgi:hypothetical protein